MALSTGSGSVRQMRQTGFTLIELLVVMTVIALLLTIALPKYFGSVERSKEAALRQDVSILREALDKYYSDNRKYPDALEDLVSRQYLREIPIDPITESPSTWVIVPPVDSSKGNVFNIKSGASGQAGDGTLYADW